MQQQNFRYSADELFEGNKALEKNTHVVHSCSSNNKISFRYISIVLLTIPKHYCKELLMLWI